jgi:hypothetical protein
VQHDSRLINAGFLGEGRVDHDVVAVKVHHAHFPVGGFPIRLSKSSASGARTWRQFAVTSTIAVVRNPFDAFFAQYQLQHTPFAGSHTSRIATKDFEALNFARDGLRFASLWNHTLAAYGAFARMRCYERARNLPRLGNRQAERCRLGVWRFETLISRADRLRALEELVDFLQLPPAHVPTREALVCAFNASDAAAFTQELIGKRLVSYQNPAGMIVEQVLVGELVLLLLLTGKMRARRARRVRKAGDSRVL